MDASCSDGSNETGFPTSNYVMRAFGAAVATGLLLAPLASANFGRSAEIPLTGQPASVLLADANQDGLADIATIYSSGPSISVLAGRGDGGFAQPVDYPVAGARSGVFGDFDSDGLEDLAVAAGATITVFAGVDGGLERRASFPVRAPAVLAAADLNSDGNLDLATASSTEARVSVLIGVGDGTFDPAVDYPVGSATESLVIADLDGDETLDIATAGSSPSILFGTGDGAFGPYTADAIGPSARSLATDDLDQDGDQDLVAARGQQVGVLLNAGDGTFPEDTSYPVAGTPTAVAIADVSGDESLDVITANRASNNISILEGVDDGTLESQFRIRVGRTPTALATFDLDQNGTTDLVVSNRGSKSVTVLLNGATAPQPTVCLVPRVVRRTLAVARALLARAHCAVATVSRKYSNRVKRGRVIAQRPAPGTRRPEDARVTLLVSRGPRR